MRESRIYHVDPVPKPRQAPKDKWDPSPSVKRYRAFCDKVRALGMTLEPGDSIIFCLQMPASWSQKKRRSLVRTPHLSRPDLSNLLKAVEDACLPEDCGMWWYTELKKLWTERGMIIITPHGTAPLLIPQSD